MFKKGQTPHNKGDSFVDGNYRNKPRPKERKAPRRERMGDPYNTKYYESLGNSFFKRWL